jgi:hypothetical protein
MPKATIGKLPGIKDINDQFSRANIQTTLEYYKGLKTADGDYQFGELTDKWYKAGAQWLADVKIYPEDVQKEIKGYIVEALTNQTDGKDDPIPLTLKWSDGDKAVKRSYDPYTIEIIGYPAPPSSALTERREKQ